MNTIEREMADILKNLKKNYGVLWVKTEFEAEGARANEVMKLRDLSNRAEIGLVIKIGGVEAISDIDHAIQIGVESLIAPMVETPFAAKKYLDAVKKVIPQDDLEDINIGINIETVTGCQNIEEILTNNDISNLNVVTVGRGDLSRSLGPDVTVESELVFEKCEKVMQSCKQRGLMCGMGGGISLKSVDFIKKLADKGLLDFFETRKIAFGNVHSPKEKISEGIIKALNFEYLWLLNKRNFYTKISQEDNERIERLKTNLESATEQGYSLK